MSRSGYVKDWGGTWTEICYRGAVASATRGARGQQLFRDMLAALDAMPEKRLIEGDVAQAGGVCALGAVGVQRGMDMSYLDPEDAEGMASAFKIAPALAREIAYMNDEASWSGENPEQRFRRMGQWVEEQIK